MDGVSLNKRIIDLRDVAYTAFRPGSGNTIGVRSRASVRTVEAALLAYPAVVGVSRESRPAPGPAVKSWRPPTGRRERCQEDRSSRLKSSCSGT